MDRKTRIATNDLFYTAHHEAAHAIAHVRGGGEPLSLSIVPDSDYLGKFAPAPGLMWCTHCYIVCLLAGYAAETKLGLDKKTARELASADFDRARQLIRREAGGRLRDWLSEADGFVAQRRNWRTIQRVALYLLRRRTIAGEELRTLVRLADGMAPEREVLRKRVLVETVTRRLRLAGADFETWPPRWSRHASRRRLRGK